MCDFLQIVSPDINVKKSCYKANIILSEYINMLNMKKDIYVKLVEYRMRFKSMLSNEDIKFLDKIVKSYERNGAGLNSKKADTLLKIKQEISKLEHYVYQYVCNIEKQ